MGSLILMEKERHQSRRSWFQALNCQKQDNHGSYNRLQGWSGNQGSDLIWWRLIDFVAHQHQLSLFSLMKTAFSASFRLCVVIWLACGQWDVWRKKRSKQFPGCVFYLFIYLLLNKFIYLLKGKKNDRAQGHDINWLEPNRPTMADELTSTRPWASVYAYCNTSAS